VTQFVPRIPALAAALAAAFALATVGPAPAQRYLYSTPPDSAHPRVVYADSSVSVNDRCIVRMIRLSRTMRPVYVNQEPIGFC
jgi:hypothetical protein